MFTHENYYCPILYMRCTCTCKWKARSFGSCVFCAPLDRYIGRHIGRVYSPMLYMHMGNSLAWWLSAAPPLHFVSKLVAFRNNNTVITMTVRDLVDHNEPLFYLVRPQIKKIQTNTMRKGNESRRKTPCTSSRVENRRQTQPASSPE